MTAYPIPNPFSQWTDTTGLPLNSAYIYIGVAGDDPETNPIAVYEDADLTIPLAQPIRTTGGYMAGTGAPINAFPSTTPYSIKVRRKQGTSPGAEVFYRPVVHDELADAIATFDAFKDSFAGPDGAENVGWLSRYTDAILGTVADYFDDRCSIMHFIPFAERVKIRARTSTADLSAYFTAAAATGDEVWVPAGTYLVGNTVTMSTASTRFRGAGAGSVVRFTDATKNGFTLAAADLGISDLRLEGSATAGTTSKFAIYTDVSNVAPRAHIDNVVFSGADSSHGFTNAMVFDTGSDYPVVTRCYIERLWGNASGFGYGVLCGAINGAVIANNVYVGSSGRGRHCVYLSAGASYCKVANNYAYGSNYESFTINTTAAQPSSSYNIIEGNTAVNPSSVGGSENFSGISIFGKSQNNLLATNLVIGSGGCGIKIDGSEQMPNQNNRAHGNTVIAAAYTGIDVIDMAGGSIIDNAVQNCSTASPGTYAAIRLASGGQPGATGCTKIIVDSNQTSGADARCGLSLNSTAPTPTKIIVDGNQFLHTLPVEFNGVVCPIDGVIEVSVGGYVRPEITFGTPHNDRISAPGALVGDKVLIDFGADVVGQNNDNVHMTASVVIDDNVDICMSNALDGTPKPTATASLYITVFRSLANAAL